MASRVFVSYRHVQPDSSLATGLTSYLRAHGLRVFIDQQVEVGKKWPAEIERELHSARAFVVFLSQASICSDMVRQEVEIAHELRQAGRMAIFPVRVAFGGRLPYDLAGYLHGITCAAWNPGDATERLWARLYAAISGGRALSSPEAGPEGAAHAAQEPRSQPELPEPAPAAALQPILETGTVAPDSHLYVQRRADAVAEACLEQRGCTVVVKGPRQSGKSSLLARLHARAQQKGLRSVYVDFQVLDASQLASLGALLHGLAEWIAHELRTTVRPAAVWDAERLGEKKSFMAFLAAAALDPSLPSLVLLLDEVDRLFGEPYRDDFFGAVRAWHNLRATDKAWQGLHLVLAHATDPALWISNLYQSPFNVGERLRVGDFTREQVADLNSRHGAPLRSSAEVEGLMHLLGGHPYLVRRALYALVVERWSLPDLERVAGSNEGPFGDHLRRHLWSIGRTKGLREALASVVAEDGCDDEETFQRLLAAGLVSGETRAAARIRCALYQGYFARHL